MMLTYKLQPFDVEIEAAYRSLLPHQAAQIDSGVLQWKFVNNPAGLGQVSVCRNVEGKIVGLNAFQRCRLMGANGRHLIGYQSMDTLVDPVARGQGVFGKLLQTFYDNHDGDLLYGFPNAASSKSFFGKQQWSFLGSAPFLIRPIRTGFFLKRIFKILPDFRWPRIPSQHYGSVEIDRFDSSVNELQTRGGNTAPFQIIRDAEYLNWRIFDKPLAPAHVLSKNMNAFAVGRIDKKHGGNIAYILEALGEMQPLSEILSDMNTYFADQGADAALAWCMPHMPNYRCYRQAGYMPLADWLRPIKINFGGKNLSVNAQGIEDVKNWYISYLDSDTV